MSRVDDELRRRLRGLERPVRTDVLERVATRKRRRRAAHRLGVVGVAAAVVLGTLAGGYGLLRVFAPGRGAGTVGEGPSPRPEPPRCAVSTVDTADLNGDGMADVIEVSADPPAPDLPCSAGEPVTYRVAVRITTAPGVGIDHVQPLPECDMPYACRVLATPDIDRDGSHEVAIQLSFGASTTTFALYRFDAEAPDGPLVRLEVVEPGDPWDPTFGLPPGPATFAWYGSVTHLHWLSCDEDPERRLAVMTALRSEEDPRRYVVHGTLLRLVEHELRPEFSWDEEVREGRLEVPSMLCGSELIPPDGP